MMITLIKSWFNTHFSHPDAMLIILFILLGTLVLYFFGGMLAPVIAAIVIAYMLEGLVQYFFHRGLSRNFAVILSFAIFLTALLFVVIGLVPVVSKQVSSFLDDLPKIVTQGKDFLQNLQVEYPNLLNVEQANSLVASIASELTSLGQSVLSLSLASIPFVITALIYFLLVPLLVFFFLKDKFLLLDWINTFLPKEKRVLQTVWKDVDNQIGNYIRGKFYEIVIVGSTTFGAFLFLGLSYATLLGVLVGLSVVVPYIGAAVVTFPVVIAAYLEFGFSVDFGWVIGVYALIQALDGNVLVPILFSDVVNLHPVAIIVAILIFGGLWGFWGVFFAIPLATLVKSLLAAWPTQGGFAEAS